MSTTPIESPVLPVIGEKERKMSATTSPVVPPVTGEKVVIVHYQIDECFKIPDGINLEDTTQVEFWEAR
jgi:hypothetical protein